MLNTLKLILTAPFSPVFSILWAVGAQWKPLLTQISYLSSSVDTVEDDLLIITADHGCDPTVEGTDHTREYVPVLYYSKNIEPKDLGLTLGFDSIANRIDKWLF